MTLAPAPYIYLNVMVNLMKHELFLGNVRRAKHFWCVYAIIATIGILVILVTIVTIGILITLVTTVTIKLTVMLLTEVTTETVGTSVTKVNLVMSVIKLVLNVGRCSCSVCYFCSILTRIGLFRQITVRASNIDFHANPSSCFMRTGGRTDVAVLMVAFRCCFANASTSKFLPQRNIVSALERLVS